MSEFRVIYHPPICPDCGSDNITEQEIETTDGLTETALICGDCGAAWPVACVAEHLEPARPSPTGTRRSGRTWWCEPTAIRPPPRRTAAATGAPSAPVPDRHRADRDPVLHYTPGPARIITADDLRPSPLRRSRHDRTHYP